MKKITKNSLKDKAPRLRTIYLKEPPEDISPWLCTPFKTRLKLKDTPYPYTSDGMISPSGYFFSVRPGGHDDWCYNTIGLMSNDLIKSGWVIVWSYESMFFKRGDTPTPYFRYEEDLPLAADQKARMISWCEGQKKTLNRALGWHYDSFMEDEP